MKIKKTKDKEETKGTVDTPHKGVSDDIDFRVLDITEVSANDYNPNDMESEYFETIVNHIREEGMNQPILVRPDTAGEKKYVIVDGEHRFRAMDHLGIKKIPVVVVPYNESMAKLRTLSFNQLRGKNIPIKLARLLVDLHKEFSPKVIREMTGIGEDNQLSVMELLDVPKFNPAESVHLTATHIDRPISVNLMLMPDEHVAYTSAMKKAMNIAGDGVVALVGNEVASYDQAMKTAMGLAGVKLRNMSLALICQSFNAMSAEQKKDAVEKATAIIYDKKMSDADSKASQKLKSDKKV